MIILVKCSYCGEEYSLGRKIYHECEKNIIRHGVIFEENNDCYDWNCTCVSNELLETYFDSIELPQEKINHTVLFE